MLKILYAGCPSLSLVILAQFAPELCVATKNRQKSVRTSILAFKVIKGHCFWCQSRQLALPISEDFLLVINGNLGPISHYSDLLAENKIFPTLLSFNAPARGDPFQICGKALRILKLESSRQPTVKIW